MIDSNPLPPYLLRLFAGLTRWLLGLLLAFWLLLGTVAGVLHGFIVPRIGDWRPQIERLATNAMGIPVQLDAITARSDGWFPTLHLQGLTLAPSIDQPSLRLENITITISARSLLRLGIEQLYIEGPQLDIRRLSQGQWRIAGLVFTPQAEAGNNRPLQWLLQQPEVVVRKGTVQFTDELLGLAPVALTDVGITVRHSPWSHSVRLDATPAHDAAGHLQVQGVFRAPLLPSSQPVWTRWHGQWYASAQLDTLPPLPWPGAWPLRDLQAQGQLRAWLDIDAGIPTGITADVALQRLQLAWQDTSQPDFQTAHLQARLHGAWDDTQWQLEARDFQFQLHPEALWPSSRWRLQAKGPQLQQLALDYADLHMAHQVASALPLPADWHTKLAQLQPQGTVRELQVRWASAGRYQAQGAIEQLTLAAQPAVAGVGVPGVEGLSAKFTLSQAGGEAHVQMQDGALSFPGVFEAPTLPMGQLQGSVRWGWQGQQLQVDVPQLHFQNADATGHLNAHWQTGRTPQSRLPGHLVLQGRLERADGARVFRYLPLSIPASARNYVRDSILQGSAENVDFEVRGDLRRIPFTEPGSGRFWIQAPLRDVTYQFVPPSLQPGGHMPWHTLTGLAGTLIFEGDSMQVRHASSAVQQHPGLRFAQIDAEIANLQQPTLALQAQGDGALAQWLSVVKASPLASFTSHSLDAAQAQGPAQLQFALELPIHQPERTQVSGEVHFQGNGFQLSPDIPALDQLQGLLRFSEQGFGLHQVQAQALGGSVQLQGGMPSVQAGVHISGQGSATAAALRADTSLPVAPWIARYANGQTRYTLDITANGGARSIAVRSNLQGLQIDLPAPLDKPAALHLPLEVRLTDSAQRQQDIHVQVGNRARVHYLRDISGPEARVVAGRIEVGVPADTRSAMVGVQAQLHAPLLDLDAWLATWPQSTTAAKSTPPSESALAYVPHTIAVHTQQLRWQQRDLGALDAQLRQLNGLWSAEVQSPHFAGQLQYQPTSAQYLAGRVYARLSHLLVPQSAVQRLQAPAAVNTDSADPKTLPALDIQVDRLEIAGKALGQLHLQAHNRHGRYGREWLLERFELQTPEAHWQANGYWGPQSAQSQPVTHLGFALTMGNAGQLLERLGQPHLIRQGEGRLSGQMAWTGSPITPNWQSMYGNVHVGVHKGQFLKAEPGMGKLLSVLSLQSLPRRFNLDFRDVFSQGFAFDTIQGDVTVSEGVAATHNLQMQGLNAAVWMEGQASLADETQQLKVVIVPEINAMTASLAATAVNPVIGLGSFVAQWLLRGPLMEAATRSFYIHGSWSDPVVEPLRKNTPSAAAVP